MAERSDRWSPRPWSAQAVMTAWERGSGGGRTDRALAMLSAVLPERSRAELLALPLGRRDHLLLEGRLHLLGPTLQGSVRCPSCSADQGFSLELDTDLLPQGVPIEAPAEEELTVHGFSLALRCPTTSDAFAVESLGPGAAARELQRRAVGRALGPDGAEVPASQLPHPVMLAAGEALERLDPLALIPLAFPCGECGLEWQPVLEVVEILWAEIDNLASRLMDEVQILAAAYGWREADILALSGRRRRFYLERAPGAGQEETPQRPQANPFQTPWSPNP